MRKSVPQYHELMNPLLRALKELGGSGSIEEIYDTVVEDLALPDDVLNIIHDSARGNGNEVQYRLAWARTYLKKYGVLENSIRGIWAIVSDKRDIDQVDPEEVMRTVRSLTRKRDRSTASSKDSQPSTVGCDIEKEEILEEDIPEESSWRMQLYRILTQELDPAAFERLVQRILRESGFVNVEVTGKSGDGGIDGKGIVRIHGILSFHVIFQCKRYQGTVGASQVRDFRGAMVGRADKGLLITTGTFTRDAFKEATRDGAPPIDLMNGDQLVDKLKELNLGIQTEIVEQVTVDESWFLGI